MNHICIKYQSIVIFPPNLNVNSWRRDDDLHSHGGMFLYDISVPFPRSLTWTGEKLRSDIPDRGRRHLTDLSTHPSSVQVLSFCSDPVCGYPLFSLHFPRSYVPQRTVPLLVSSPLILSGVDLSMFDRLVLQTVSCCISISYT